MEENQVIDTVEGGQESVDGGVGGSGDAVPETDVVQAAEVPEAPAETVQPTLTEAVEKAGEAIVQAAEAVVEVPVIAAIDIETAVRSWFDTHVAGSMPDFNKIHPFTWVEGKLDKLIESLKG